MLGALLADLARLPGVETTTLLAVDCQPFPVGGSVTLSRAEEERRQFARLSRQSDHVILIAPESDDILPTRCRWVEELGGNLLGSSSSAVQLTGDKLLLGDYLRSRDIVTPPVSPFAERKATLPVVCKPRHGAGSQHTFLIQEWDQLDHALEIVEAEGGTGEFILQPFIAGTAVSMSFLVGPRQIVPLLSGCQRLSADGRFRYEGGTIPLSEDLHARAGTLARRAVDSVEGLRGFVGVDLVLAEDGRDAVIEINPRLTTSYLGLRALAETNLAAAWLSVATGGFAPGIRWRPGRVSFQPDGAIDMSESGPQRTPR